MGLMVVDRREGEYAILIPEDNPNEEIMIPYRFLQEIEEGDIIEISFKKDEIATKIARERIRRTIERLKNK
jgi:hypothetical protein